MRKLLSLLLALALLSLPLPGALADSPLPYEAHTVLSGYALTPFQRELLAYLYPHVLAGNAEIDVPRGTAEEDIDVVFSALHDDYPELFHFSGGYGWSTVNGAITTVRPDYRLSISEADSLRTQLMSTARQMVRAASTPDALHDALMERVSYGGQQPYCQMAVGALLHGQSVCEGYAQALSLLFRLMGVPCGVVSGTADNGDGGGPEGHAWNIAVLDGSFTYIDPTWNDPTGSDTYNHNYYGLSTAQMSADHFLDAEYTVPIASDAPNWHRVRGLLISDLDQLYAMVRDTVVRDGRRLEVRFTDAALYRAVVHGTDNFLRDYNAWADDWDDLYQTLWKSYNDDVLTLSMWVE